MLEIKGLTKVYKTKGGADVRALDDVSVKFEEKGMVFLLGKSGSGKSTLLNLCGGLDTPDSGEIIIKGRSSKDFTQSDFDSYRNTFIGFVFQEYNILNEFSVEDNIALALELQGKNKNKEQVNAILEQVDLVNFAKRKPNTLSGGQKQRVAIARALVKNPEIIMADEPTGALDSNTGKQVFDTLKKLSEEKLVLVVSHDREFAEIYGDRIIELKDGKIISDFTKTKIAPVAASDNVRFVGDDTISIKSGTKLNAKDLEQINKFLAASNEDVIITNGKKEISDFRKAARIDEDGARETFKSTETDKIVAKTYSSQESRFIRSKLPARHAIRIGASSMKVKPFRLLFTILLSFIAFALFGLFSTLTFYDKTSTAVQTYLDSGYDSLMLQKKYNVTTISYTDGQENYRYSSLRNARFTPAELDEYRNSHGANSLGVFNYDSSEYDNSTAYPIENVHSNSDFNSNYYSYQLLGFAEFADNWSGTLLTPETDLSALGENDVVISSYTFDSIKEANFSSDPDKSDNIVLNTYSDIVGKKLYLRSKNSNDYVELTVRGVYENDLPAAFDNYQSQGNTQLSQEDRESIQNELKYGTYQYALVADTFYQAHLSEFETTYSDYVDYGFTYLNRTIRLTPIMSDPDTDLNYYTAELYSINSLPPQKGAVPTSIAYLDGRDASASLAENEVVVSYNMIRSIMIDYMLNAVYQRLAEEESYEIADAYYQQMTNVFSALESGYISQQDPDTMEYTQHYLTDEELKAAAELAIAFIEQCADTDYAFPSQFNFTYSDMDQSIGDFTIVGFFYGTMCSQNGSAAYLSENDYQRIRAEAASDMESSYYSEEVTKYQKEADARYNYIAIEFPDSESTLRTLLQGENVINADNDLTFVVYSVISAQLSMVNGLIETLWQIFLYVGIVMAVFAMLLLFNFISVSISYKKKEIGILRAVGARSADVFKIFYSESIIITAICFVLAIIACFVTCGLLNNTVTGAIGASIFVFGPLSWLVMLGIAVVTSFIATFLPVYSIAKRKPVESIRAL